MLGDGHLVGGSAGGYRTEVVRVGDVFAESLGERRQAVRSEEIAVRVRWEVPQSTDKALWWSAPGFPEAEVDDVRQVPALLRIAL
ncbi:hypothetical protein AN216_20260 [Streptomyces oceani]|uniref:Uncharacterized protein n=1 Tax=Streptomyces oceani TaxID=1075402 RepID=A0A1E7JXV0_9ACTN|nr:hypothetical protein AN216_20260 [Streptomyces oceani]